MQRIGLATGYDPTMAIRDMVRWVTQADERGFEIGFFSETIELMRDSVSALTALGLATKKMTLGCTQTVRVRSPVVMAQTLVSLDELTGGRMILSPGACTNSHARRYGLEPMDPVLTLTEWATVIRGLVAGGKVTFRGESVNIEGVELGWEPIRKQIPLWIPATSRTGLRNAGKIGDGVLLNAVCSPEYSAKAIEIVRQSVADAGKDWEGFEVAQLINCSVEDDHESAINATRWEVASKFDPLQIPFIAGPKMRVGEPYIKKEDIPVFEEAYRRDGKFGLMEAVPDSYVEGMTASGTPQEAKERVEQYLDAGVKLPILRPAALHQTQRIIDLFAPM